MGVKIGLAKMDKTLQNQSVYMVFCAKGRYDDYEEWIDSVWVTKEEAEKRKEEILDLQEEDRNTKLNLADELQEKEKAGLISSWQEAFNENHYKNKVSEEMDSIWIETFVVGEKPEFVKSPSEKRFEDWEIANKK